MKTSEAGRHQAPSSVSLVQRHPVAPTIRFPDPLDADAIGDGCRLVSRRGLVRLALVASETGARFQREGTIHDPLMWLATPRPLFEGRAALDACTERESCLRAVVLHGLGLGLDADADEVDDLIGDDEDGVEPCRDRRGSGSDGADGPDGRRPNSPRLFTSTLVYDGDTGVVQAFDAAVLGSVHEMRDRISRRLGSELAQAAEIVEGFRPTCPLVDAFVTDAMAHMLRQVAEAPASALAAGLEIVVQQRFAM